LPQLWIIAGPNGAGKTTLVSRRIGQRIEVVNPDIIAREIPSIDGRPNERRAGQLAVKRRNDLLDRKADFAIETTLSGASALRFLQTAKIIGYKVTLVYVGLASADLSVQRVLDRVRQGGHAVPITAIERRFPDAMSKVGRAVALADRSYVFDNSGRRRRLLMIRDASKIRFVAANLPDWAVTALGDILG
jgi:predicted ABC-type ATPase